MELGCAREPPPDPPDPPQVAHEHPPLARCAERAIFLRDRMCGASAVTTPLLGQRRRSADVTRVVVARDGKYCRKNVRNILCTVSLLIIVWSHGCQMFYLV